MPPLNTLYYGDNLDVLNRHIDDESVDLVYLDPPFKSNRDYNVLFQEKDGSRSSSQILAFEDTWEWNVEAERTYEEVVEFGGKVSDAMRAFRTFLGSSDMMAYLAMMAPRLKQLSKVLRPTGSIYLHCDPAASHYLKMLMDAVFGAANIRNEIVWKRTGAHNSAKRYGPVHDTLLFYSKSDTYTWNQHYSPQDEYIKERYTYVDEQKRFFYPVSLVAAGVRHGSSGECWHGIDVTANGNHWRYSIENLERLDAKGDIYWPKKGGKPRLKMYATAAKGSLAQDWWGDIPPLNSQSQERLGYPTQKPQALLERIISASSNPGDIVLDPFCGCGTAIEAAQKLERTWYGIDVTHLAIGLIKHRLQGAFGDSIWKEFEVIGEPVTVPDARVLAQENPYQFQYWALGLVGARSADQKKGADRGVDGRLYFHDERSGLTKQIVFSVKSGEHLSPAFVRDLSGVVQREKAQIGVLITLHRPTKEMLKEAASGGFYESHWGKHPKLQILTIEQLLRGDGIDRPPTREVDVTLKKRARSEGKRPEQLRLPG